MRPVRIHQTTGFFYEMLVLHSSFGALNGDRQPARRRRSAEKSEGGKRLVRRFRLWGGGKQLLEDIPRWWLTTLLVFAPWAYGTTTSLTKQILTGALLALIGLFAVSLVLRRRWPRIHWLTALLSLFLLAQGWLMTWNPKLVYDPAVFYFHNVQQPITWLPGTVDQETSFRQMLLITGLFGAFWVAMDAAANPRWRDRLWLVMSLTGVSIMILGLLQRVMGAPAIFWQTNLDCGSTFFATYRYHANAGAFINIVLPLITGKMLCALRRKRSDRSRVFWILASLGTFVSAFVNVSRAATLISVLMVFLFLLWELREQARVDEAFLSKRRIGGITLILIIAVSLLVWAVGFDEAREHWTELANSIATSGRFVVYDLIIKRLLPVSGLWGFGPATFQIIFPFFTNSVGKQIMGIWEYAHEDYLETLVEWGVCGAVAWFLLFSSTIIPAVWTFYRLASRWDRQVRTFAMVVFLALGSVLVHALVDFPLQIAALQLYASVLLGLLATLNYQRTKSARRIGRRQTPVTDDGEGTFSAARPNGE